MHFTAAAITVLTGLGIIYIGIQYVFAPLKSAQTFGLPTWPTQTGWLQLKGFRDIASGLVVLIPLALGEFQVLGYLMLAASVTPFGDMLTVLRHGGSRTAAYAIHGLTAVVVVIGGIAALLA